VQGHFAAAVRDLQTAVVLSESMGYIEPPRVMHTLRACLSVVLVLSGEETAAVEVSLVDLQRLPGNMWALAALDNALGVGTSGYRGHEGLPSPCMLILGDGSYSV
jgi:hypothetical protein